MSQSCILFAAKMIEIIQILALVLIAPINFCGFVSAHFTCPSTDYCSCNKFFGGDIICQSNEGKVDIYIDYTSDPGSISYICKDAHEINSEIIPEIKLDGEYYLYIFDCLLTNNKSVASYIKNITVKIKGFSFYARASKYNKNATSLARHHLKGLEDVEKILIFGNGNIESLSSDLFYEMSKMKNVTIRNMEKISLPENIFDTLENLEYLRLDRLNLPSLDPALFKNMKKLKGLNINSNSLRSISNGTFNGLAMLEELSISDSKMESIEPMLLSELTNLKEIHLEWNSFKSFPAGFLFTNKRLQTFMLYVNRADVDALPNDFLANLPDLKEIKIECNLKVISEDIFKGSDGIEKIDLSHNQIAELPENLVSNKASLTTLSLENNHVSEIPELLFSDTFTLTELDLSKNKIKNIAE